MSVGQRILLEAPLPHHVGDVRIVAACYPINVIFLQCAAVKYRIKNMELEKMCCLFVPNDQDM